MSSLIKQLKQATRDLLYPSESDYPLESFIWKRDGPIETKSQAIKDGESRDPSAKNKKKRTSASELENKGNALSKAASTSPQVVTTASATADEVLRFGGHHAKTEIEEISLEEFFSRVTKIEDWFGDEEKETAQRFADLQKLLEDNLKRIKVFRVGQVEITVYVVGVDRKGNLVGLKTTVIET